MTQIPFGYRVECGGVKLDIINVIKVQNCYRFYLFGASIEEAGKEAGILRSRSGIGKILSDPVYLGDGYYPQIIWRSLFEKVQKERERRNRNLRRQEEVPSRLVSVPGKFNYVDSDIPEDVDPIRRAEMIYRRILPL